MDRHIWDHAEIPVNIDQSALDAIRSAHRQSACYGERSVHPGGKDHAAVFLGVQAHIVIFYRKFRFFLHLKAWGIAMCRCHMEPFHSFRRNSKSDHGRIIALRVIFSTLHKLPFLVFPQSDISCLFQHCSDIHNRMKTGGAFLYKIQHFFRCLLKIIHVNRPVLPLPTTGRHLSLAFRAHGIIEEILIGQTDTVFQLRRIMIAETLQLADI